MRPMTDRDLLEHIYSSLEDPDTGLRTMLKDHEKRLRSLERLSNMGIGAVMLVSFTITALWHGISQVWTFISNNLPPSK